jgi:hypothetical protein
MFRPIHRRKAHAAPERIRCKNCGTPFIPKVDWQECCSEQCRKQFWKFRGPTWPKIEDAIRKEVARQLKAAILAGKIPPLKEEESHV